MGNDVVDLKEPDNRGKSGDKRFLTRVFTAQEREQIAQAAAPDTLLWSFWAAKEAAYKAVSGGDPPVCSVPRRYPVHLNEELETDAGSAAVGVDRCLTGRVVTPRGEIALWITVTDDYVHAIAAEFDADVTGIIQRVDRMEDGGNPGDPSVFVRRQLLAEISRRLDCSIDELTVRNDPSGSGAPRVFRGDRPLSLEISLSHDGRFTAFALLFR